MDMLIWQFTHVVLEKICIIQTKYTLLSKTTMIMIMIVDTASKQVNIIWMLGISYNDKDDRNNAKETLDEYRPSK